MSVHEYRNENLKHLLPFSGDSFLIQDYSYLAFRGFANSRGRPKNKNTSLDPSVQKSIKIDSPNGSLNQGDEGEQRSSHHGFSAKKKNNKHYYNIVFGGEVV